MYRKVILRILNSQRRTYSELKCCLGLNNCGVSRSNSMSANETRPVERVSAYDLSHLRMDYVLQQSLHTATNTFHSVIYPTLVAHIKEIFQSFNWVLKCHSKTGSILLTPVQICLWCLDVILYCINWLKWHKKEICFPFQLSESSSGVNKASSLCYVCSRQNLHCIVPCVVINLL